jgi:hypothetical protein
MGSFVQELTLYERFPFFARFLPIFALLTPQKKTFSPTDIVVDF